MNLDSVSGHPSMDYPAHLATYRGFVTTGLWICGILAVVLALMAAFLV